MIREAQEKDFKAIAEIYNYYIRHTVITFEESEIDQVEVSNRINKVKSSDYWWLVLEKNQQILGYAYATKWQERSAYRNTAEVSVYLHHQSMTKGYGTALYEELFHRLKAKSLHSVIGGIALPNASSEKLHEKFGMEKVAHFTEVGYKFGQWIDVGYWQAKINA